MNTFTAYLFMAIGKGAVFMAKLATGFRKRKSGGYEYRFTYNGVRYSVGGATTAECKKKAKEKQALLDVGVYQTNDKITLNQYFDEWIKQKEMAVKESTIFIYKVIFHGNIAPILGKHKVKTLERRQVVDMLKHIAKERGTGAASHARRLIVSVLNGAMKDDIVLRNVAAGIPSFKATSKPARETIHRELTDQELKIFFSLAKVSRYYNVFKFLLNTGVRVGECCGLQWKDIDRKHGIVHIRKTVTRDKEGKWVLGDTTKTRTSKRDIPMNKAIREIIENQWGLYCNTHNGIALNDLVFSNEHEGIINTGSLNGLITHVLNRRKGPKVKIAPFSVHAFRDTFASRAIRAGIAPNTLKELMGHSSLSMTMDLYAHVNQQDKIESMEKLQAIDL